MTKSSAYRTHLSIDAFAEKFSERVGTRYILHVQDVVQEGTLQCLPVYMSPLV